MKYRFVFIIISAIIIFSCGSAQRKKEDPYQSGEYASNEAEKAFNELEGKPRESGNNSNSSNNSQNKKLEPEKKDYVKNDYSEKKEKPDWIHNRPQNSDYFIGIGVATDSGNKEEDIQRAKDNALAEISSQISVTITSEIEDAVREFAEKSGDNETYVTKEMMKSKVSSYSNEVLEGVEFVDSWTSSPKEGYWFYYRLDKDVLRIRFENARDKAVQYFRKALENLNKYEIALSVQNYVDALAAIDNYLGKPIRVTHPETSKEIILQDFIKQDIERILNDIFIEVKKESYNVKKGNLPRSISARFTFKGRKLYNFPVKAEIKKGSGEFSSNVLTDREGTGQFQLYSLNPDGKNAAVVIVPEVSRYLKNYEESKILQTSLLLKTLKIPNRKIEFNFMNLNIFVSEKTESGVNLSPVVSKVKRFLANKLSAEFVNSKNDSDYYFEITLNTRKGSEIQGLYFVFSSLTFSCYRRSGEQLYQVDTKEVKQGGLSYKQAEERSVNDLSNAVDRNFIKKLASNLKY